MFIHFQADIVVNPKTTTQDTAPEEFLILPMSRQQQRVIASSSEQNKRSTRGYDGETVIFCRKDGSWEIFLRAVSATVLSVCFLHCFL